MALCEWCLALGGRFHAGRECCHVRMLAGAPQHARAAAYDQARREGGASALDTLKAKVKAEYERQNAGRIAVAKAAMAKLKELTKAK